MILNESDVYDYIESYRNKMRISQEKMADILGLSSKQAYGNMLRNKTIKLAYVVSFVNKTETSLADLFGLPVNHHFDREEKEHVVVNDTAMDNSEVDKLKMRLEFIEEQMEKKEKLIAQLHRENGALEEKLSNMGGSISQQSVG